MGLDIKIWDNLENKWFEAKYGAYHGELSYLLLNQKGEIIWVTQKNGGIQLSHESTFPDRFTVYNKMEVKELQNERVG